MKLTYLRYLLGFKNLIDGLISGFPLCCILYFIRHDGWFKLPAEESMNKYKQERDSYHGYVRCPDCIRQNYYIKQIRAGGLGPNTHSIFLQAIKLMPNRKIAIDCDFELCDNSDVREFHKNRIACFNCGCKYN